MKMAATHNQGNGHMNRHEDTNKPRYTKSRAVKMLEAMAMADARRRMPTVPHLAPRIFRDDTANGLTKCILEFLKLSGHQAERIANMGRPVDRRHTFTDTMGHRRQIGSLTWVKGSGTRGSADVSATIMGRSVKVEVKIGADRMSEAQQRYRDAVEAAGGLYVVARSFEQFRDWYNETFCHE